MVLLTVTATSIVCHAAPSALVTRECPFAGTASYCLQARGLDIAMGRHLGGLVAHESVDAMLRVLGGNMPLLRVREMLRFHKLQCSAQQMCT